MQITATGQSTRGPADKPAVANPVEVTLDIPVFYMSDRGPVVSTHPIFCGRAFADTVLTQVNTLLQGNGLGLVHLGVYNPRKARRADGSPIVPERWSNHAFGEAMDFKGVTQGDNPDQFTDVRRMATQMTQLLQQLRSNCDTAITGIRRRPEIVDEVNWLHVGIWP